MMQGVPLGLAYGSVPFILERKLSYTQLGLFSLSGYPYSLKLLWSPVVDSLYSNRIGRRKSWIVPTQLATAAVLVRSHGSVASSSGRARWHACVSVCAF